MKTAILICTVSALLAGMVCAQETESAQSILQELGKYKAEEQPAAVPAATPPAVTVKPAPAPVAAAVEPPVAEAAAVQEPSAPVNVPAMLETGREQYVAGNFEAARPGFEKVLIAEPHNPVARYYLEKMAEYRRKRAGETAIREVSDSWNGMVLRDYPLSAEARKSLGVEDAADAVDVKASFPEIAFPDDAYAIYRPKLNRLFVLNTLSNVEKLEVIMASMTGPREDDGGQVEIEARFVEFSEGALDELGFKWADPSDADAIHAAGDWSLADGSDLFSGALRSVPFQQTGALAAESGLSEVRSRTGSGIDNWSVNRIEDLFHAGALTDAEAVSLTGRIGGSAVDLLIRALDQTSGADVLSAPSLVTLSGEPATITVGERHFYPATYEAGTSQGTMLHVKYEDFSEKILGVEMTVTPTIKGDEIQMTINPRITELLGWQKFQLAPADTSYNYFQYRIGEQYEHDPVVAQLPLFYRRELTTEVSVASGSTVGMGGLIGEKTESFSDRVPVLGSIPLVGRLFRSEGERTVKRNLMIFVTASKVTPDGRIVSERSFE